MINAVLARTVEQLLATAVIDRGDGNVVLEVFERNRITHRQLDAGRRIRGMGGASRIPRSTH